MDTSDAEMKVQAAYMVTTCIISPCGLVRLKTGILASRKNEELNLNGWKIRKSNIIYYYLHKQMESDGLISSFLR